VKETQQQETFSEKRKKNQKNKMSWIVEMFWIKIWKIKMEEGFVKESQDNVEWSEERF
jgi:hypothetical protein